MKITQYLFVLLALIMSVQINAQAPKDGAILTAIRLKAEVAQEYAKGVQVTGFTIDKKGVLRPSKGYEIVYVSIKKQVVVRPAGQSITPPSFDVQPVPGGVMFCLCGGSGPDPCKINLAMDSENGLNYFCEGGNCCGSFIIYDTSDPVVDYETAGGKWFNF
ncbi:MAG: hypothetical protein KDC34_01560 [Saprospiraceae bacterium]|nr:hypothetical protein [Saprospiraceae bacterium]